MLLKLLKTMNLSSKTLLTEKSLSPDDFPGEFYLILKKKKKKQINLIIQNLLNNRRREGNSFQVHCTRPA